MLGVVNDLLKVESYVCMEVTAVNRLPSTHWLQVDRAEEEGNFPAPDTSNAHMTSKKAHLLIQHGW